MTALTTITFDNAAHELEEDFLSQILETAVQGACSYWADVSVVSDDSESSDDRAKDFDLSDYTDEDDNADSMDETHVKAASFTVSNDPAQGGTLDLRGVADAAERIANGDVEVPSAIREIIRVAVEDGDASDIDAEVADCIVQVGLFDEIVYS